MGRGSAASDRWTEWALRAYPVPWRTERGAELRDTVRVLLPPGRRPGVLLLIDLVYNGWRTRLREHPPVGVWLRYRLLDGSTPPRWRPWMRQEILGSGFLIRRLAPAALTFGVLFLALGPGNAVRSSMLSSWSVGAVVGYTVALPFRDRLRRRALARHGLGSAEGPPRRPVHWPTPIRTPRPVLQIWPLLIAGGAVGTMLAVPWQWALTRHADAFGTAPAGWTGPLMPGYAWKLGAASVCCAAMAGLMCVAVLMRLPRRLPLRTAINRGRTIRTATARTVFGAVAAAGLWGGLAAVRYTVAVREPYTAVLHCAVLLIAPVALAAGIVARHAERSGAATVTLSDVVYGTFGLQPTMPEHRAALVFPALPPHR